MKHVDPPYMPYGRAELDTMIEWFDEVDLDEKVIERTNLLHEGRRRKPVVTPEQREKNLADQKKAKPKEPRRPPGREDPYVFGGTIRGMLGHANETLEKTASYIRTRYLRQAEKLQAEVAVIANTAFGEEHLSREAAERLLKLAHQVEKSGFGANKNFRNVSKALKQIAMNRNPPWMTDGGQRSKEFKRDFNATVGSAKYGKKRRGAEKAAYDKRVANDPIRSLLESISAMAGQLPDVAKDLIDQVATHSLEAGRLIVAADRATKTQGAMPERQLGEWVKAVLETRDQFDAELNRWSSAIRKRAEIIMSRFKGSKATVQLEDHDELGGIVSDLRGLLSEGSYNPQAGRPTMEKISQPNEGRRTIRSQIESVRHILADLPMFFDEEALEPIHVALEELSQNPNDREAASELEGLMIQLAEELNVERQDPYYRHQAREDILAYASVAMGVAESLGDIYGEVDGGMEITTEDDDYVMEDRPKVSFLKSQNKRVMRKRARQRVEAMQRLIDQTQSELGGGKRGGASVKKKLVAIMKHKAGDNDVTKTIQRAKTAMNGYLRRYKVSKDIRYAVMAQFFAIREDFGMESTVPGWAEKHMFPARTTTSLDFWELGDEPEAPLASKSGALSVSAALKDLGKSVGVGGMSKRKTKDLLADPFGVA